MQNTETVGQSQRKAILGTVVMICLLPAAVPITYVAYHFFVRHVPTLFVRPLKPAVAADFCSLLELERDSRGQQEQAYSYEFFVEPRSNYGRGVSIEQVNEAIGAYQLACGDWINRGDNGDFQDCRYSFEGDQDFVLHLTFQKDTDASEETSAVWQSCSYDVRNGSLWDVYACQPELNTGFLLVMSDNTFFDRPRISAGLCAH